MIKKTSGSLDLIDIIASNGCIQLLEPFLYKPGIEMYQAEVIKKTGVPLNRALKLLRLLASHGILIEEEKAGSKFYSVSGVNPVLTQLKQLINVSKLYDLSIDYSDRDIEMYLFGSAAKGEDTENSDIDLLIIADSDKKTTLNKLISRIKNKMKREVSPIIYTPIEYANLYNKEKAFYESIERYKIKVL